ncbi:PAS-domain containing protein [Niveibacterium sp. SC-1]|uniref:PAS-domain containing protein n=1 Tax=Niveibacterium sp. SC-1 TaxID=3135646 RepID=UPI00311D9561
MRRIALPDWLPQSVRARLLLAFSVLFIAAMVLAFVGWRGIQGARQALTDFQTRTLSDIAISLELAQRTAAVTALAPYVTEANRPFQLQTESQVLRSRMRETEQLTQRLSAAGRERLGLDPTLVALNRAVEELIEVTRRDLFLREDLRERLYALERTRATSTQNAASDALFRDISLATSVDDAELLTTLHRHVAVQAADYARQHAGDALAELFRRNSEGNDNVFALREQQFSLRERRAFLLAFTRAESARLADRVDTYVESTRKLIDQQSQKLDRAVRSGILGIALITLLCVIVAAFATRLVMRLMGALRDITGMMSRLAEGDTEPRTIRYTSERDELGALSRAFQVFRDNALAMRKLAADLSSQRSLLTTVFESIRDGLSVFDPRGRLVTANSRYHELLGLPEAAVQPGVTLEALQAQIPAPFFSEGGGVLARLNRERQYGSSTFELEFRDGRVVEVRSNLMPDGGFVTLYSDLTERRLVEAQLRQSQKMEVLGQLTGGVAHDFNNLLAALTGNLYLAQQDAALDENTRRFIDRAHRVAERGAALTERLLAFAARQQLIPNAVQVDRMLADLADLITYSVGSGIQLDLNLNAPEAAIWVDRAQLENALLNLALNARDAMPQGGRLTLGTSVAAEQVRIVVRDTGSGIPHHLRGKVFEPFFTTKAGSGHGLGLSIVYGFVRQSGGDLQLESHVGEGTAFCLMFPLLTDAPQREPETPEGLPAPASFAVLLVEDDEAVRAAIAGLLSAEGHTVRAVASAEAALEVVAQAEPDLVLSDVDLGSGRNGLALMQELAEAHPALPLILMSGLPFEILTDRLGLPEDAVVLRKPFTPHALREAIQKSCLLA